MKFCSYCGKEISEETDLCPFCRNPSSHTSKNTKKKKMRFCNYYNFNNNWSISYNKLCKTNDSRNKNSRFKDKYAFNASRSKKKFR